MRLTCGLSNKNVNVRKNVKKRVLVTFLLGFVCEFGREGKEMLGKKGMSKWKK